MNTILNEYVKKDDEEVIQENDKKEIITLSEVLNLTKEAIKKRETVGDDAIKEAIEEVTKNLSNKIKEACKKFTSYHSKRFVEIYSFEYVDDKKATHDKNGSKVIFNGVRFSNILKYNNTKFIDRLNLHINGFKKGPFYCYFRIWKNGFTTKWSIYVAWNESDTLQESKSHMIDETNK
jgi:predicted nucleic acid-binding protein